MPVFPQVIRPGLERVRKALDILGHPEEAFASVLVAGTNGKGSVSAMIESGLRTAGHRTGLFTSPHLVDVRERVQVAGGLVSRSEWHRATARISSISVRHRLALTEFEAYTLAAFLVFERAKVELAVLEVGLGGRLDAVNAVVAPELSIITSIGLDHMAWLGPTVHHIYREKRGIARPGTPLIQDLPRSLWPEARRFSQSEGIPTWTLGREISIVGERRGQRFSVHLPNAHYETISVPLWGAHQVRNGALAVAALHVLSQQGWCLKKDAVLKGIARARWPGRFEVVRRNPPVVLDGAHNPAAARALTEAWRSSPWGRSPVTLIFGCLLDKDVRGLITALAPIVTRVIVMGVSSVRSRPARELAVLWKGHRPTMEAKNFREAWRMACEEKGTPILVAGSLYLVGEAKNYFRRSR